MSSRVMTAQRDLAVQLAGVVVIAWQGLSSVVAAVCPLFKRKPSSSKGGPLTSPQILARSPAVEGSTGHVEVWKDIVAAAPVSADTDLARAEAVRRLVRIEFGERVELKLARRSGDLADDAQAAGVTAFFRFEDFAGPLGCAAVEQYGNEGLLRSILLLEHRRGTGAGAEMVGQVMDAAAAMGIGRLWLLTETLEPFFTKLGFRRVGRHALAEPIARSSGLSSGSAATTICMTIDLSPRP